MAHRIQNNMVAWVGEKPWHGLGFEVMPGTTGKVMQVKAKLDWKVQRRSLAMRDAHGKALLVQPLANYVAIVREDNNEVFQVCSKGYYPLQTEEIVEFFREYCEAGHATMETLGGIDGGRKVWALAKLNGGSDLNIGGVDKLQGYLLLATSFDGTLRTIGKATQVRVVCWNTLSAALGLTGGKLGKKEVSEFRMKHNRKWTPEVAKEAKQVMGMAMEQIQKANETAEKLSKVNIDDKGRLEFVVRLIGDEELSITPTAEEVDAVLAKYEENDGEELNRMGKALIEAIKTSPGSSLVTAKDTLWGAVNGVTYYVDHQHGRSVDTRLSGAWFGDGDKMKKGAVKVALEMAGVN